MKRSLIRRFPFFVTMLTAALIVVGWRAASAGPCISDGQTCRTDASCCSGVCVKATKKSFGTCNATTTTATSSTTTTTVNVTCGTVAPFPTCGGTCPPNLPVCRPERIVDNTGTHDFCGCGLESGVCTSSQPNTCLIAGVCPAGELCTFDTAANPTTCGCTAISSPGAAFLETR